MSNSSTESIRGDYSPNNMQSKRGTPVIEENAASSKDGRVKKTNREARLKQKIAKNKRKTFTEPAEACGSSQQDGRVNAGKRKRLEGGEEASNKKQKTRVEDAPEKSRKRKASADVEEPSNKRKRSLDPEERTKSRTNREASLEQTITKKKRKRVTESTEACSSSEQDDRVKAGKRKRLEGKEEPSNKKQKTTGLEFAQNDNTSASFLVDAGKESKNAEDDPGTSADVDEPGTSAHVEEPRKKRKRRGKKDIMDARIAEFTAKYQRLGHLGEGGFGTVYAGFRLSDDFPVAIKYMKAKHVANKIKDENGKWIPTEVAALLKLSNGSAGSSGMSGSVSLLDWYDLGKTLILVMERPSPCTDLWDYTFAHGGKLKEKKARIIMKQLVNAAKELEDNNIFHRDIKLDNILIETSSDHYPRAQFIDFGLSCFTKRNSAYKRFMGPAEIAPPELLSGSVYKPGPTTVWQLGAVLYDILHVEQFETEKFFNNQLRIRRVSEYCQDFLQTCLMAVPEHRPTLEELLLHPWFM